MKTIFLIPPSEWKLVNWIFEIEKLSFNFEKPISIAINASEKCLKCKWNRYSEAIELNKTIENSKTLKAIERYSWIMYKYINYENMSEKWKKIFENNFLIISWFYWLIKPLDLIWNYKLPIETKLLYKFWWDKITEKLNNLNPDFIVNLLPESYFKVINKDKINPKIININFLTNKNWKVQKLTHWVKNIKWKFIRNICEEEIIDYYKFGWEIIDNWKIINVNFIY